VKIYALVFFVFVFCFSSSSHLYTSCLLTESNSRHSRKRKARCDGGRPVCLPCIQRCSVDAAAEPCAYDVAPTRRGKDKDPGGRQRGTQRIAYAEGGATPNQKPTRSRRRARADRGVTVDLSVNKDEVLDHANTPDLLVEQKPQVHQHSESASHAVENMPVSSGSTNAYPSHQPIALPVLHSHDINAPGPSHPLPSTSDPVPYQNTSTYVTYPAENLPVSSIKYNIILQL
jgi:hypothetical protein